MVSSREKYFKNYQFEQVPDNSKKGYKNIYKYVGDYYTWDIPSDRLKFHKALFALSELATVAIFVLTAMQNISLNKTAYIVIPAVLSICAWIFEMIAVGFFCLLKSPLKEEDYKRIDSTFFITFMFRFLCLLLVTTACIIDTIRLSLGVQGVLVAFGYLLCAAIALMMKLQYKKLNTKKKVIPAK